MRILSVMSHPDDMELKCGGTLIKYKQAGHDVFSCNVANGNMGHMVIMPDELREIRNKETRNSCAIAGVEMICADFGDLTIEAGNEKQKRELIRIIRYAKPDVIITHDPNDYCSDHVEVSKLVFNASFSASCPHFYPELGEAAPLACVYYAENDSGINFIPTEYVDISDVIDKKLEMLKCHQSQITWLLEHDNMDVVEEARIRSAYRGRQCGVEYAEAFRPMLVDGRMRPFRVLPQ